MGQSQKSEGTAIANQLHKCHIMLVKCRNYITPESVAILSLWQKCHVKCDQNVTLLKYHRPPPVENDPPPVENESHPTSGNNSVDPTEGIM
jgi:hypothetical protein